MMAIGTHQNLGDAPLKALTNMRDKRPAVEGFKPLVATAHAAALATGQDHPSEFVVMDNGHVDEFLDGSTPIMIPVYVKS
ncbi:hypothetical protein GCM10017767_32520 [Halomonas urumqiensis]|nr:hypothetical protein GCM10017767_32520 [Halomonas urumqiensis]